MNFLKKTKKKITVIKKIIIRLNKLKFKEANLDNAKINEGLIILNKLPKLFYIDFIDSFYKKNNVINFIKKKIIIHYLKFNWRGLYNNYFSNFKTINRRKRFNNIKDSQKGLKKISEVDTIFEFNISSKEKECYNYGFYVSEISETFLILNILNRYKNFIDVGAHLGFYSYLLSNHKKKVFAFEPNPYCFYKIKKNKYLRKFKIGLGDKKIKKLLNIKSPYSGGSNFGAEKGRDFYSLNAKITTLDNLTKDYHLEKTLIKIDCEGFENDVLKGGANILKKYKPDIIIDIRNKKQFDTLKNFDYKIYPIIMKPAQNQYILAKQMKNFYASENIQNAFCVNYNFKKMQNLKIDLKIFTNPSVLNEVIDEFKILKI
jgi:FkbM family methyltransferase